MCLLLCYKLRSQYKVARMCDWGLNKFSIAIWWTTNDNRMSEEGKKSILNSPLILGITVYFARVACSRSQFQLKRICWKIVHRVGGFFLSISQPPFVSCSFSLLYSRCLYRFSSFSSFSSFIQRIMCMCHFEPQCLLQTPTVNHQCCGSEFAVWTFVVLDMVAVVYIVNCCTKLWLMK